MTLDQFRIFLAVAERDHMTRAAEMLGMTHSAVSAAISALAAERGLGMAGIDAFVSEALAHGLGIGDGAVVNYFGHKHITFRG